MLNCEKKAGGRKKAQLKQKQLNTNAKINPLPINQSPSIDSKFVNAIPKIITHQINVGVQGQNCITQNPT